MDRKCVLDWLNKVYIAPSLSYSEYTDEEIRIFAHNALALLKEQEKPKMAHWIDEEPNSYTRITKCSECGGSPPFTYVSDDYYGGRGHGETVKTRYCPHCGAKMDGYS